MAAGPEIIVLGSVTTSSEGLAELLEESLAHVRRSRTEPGCIAHGVSRDEEDPLRLVFVERWADRAALDRHFEVPASGEFVAVVGRLATAPPSLDIYEVTQEMPAGGRR
jgi:quinol monooxygenase YgiN